MSVLQLYWIKVKYRIIALALTVINRDFNYTIGDFRLCLPPEHALPRYQALYPQYDTFLLKLATVLPENSFVVDVGANCGDSAAAILSGNASLNLVCIEADKMFFRYLLLNSSVLEQGVKGRKIVLKEALIGQQNNALLIGKNGTRKAYTAELSDENLLIYSTLDEQLEGYLAPVSLLKIDVDGYDYDVLNSATNLLLEQRPLVFFEYLCPSMLVLDEYKKTLNSMAEKGYSHWWVFDNFGTFIMSTSDVDVLIALQADLLLGNGQWQNSKCEYFDVLAAQDYNASLAEDAVALYQVR